MRQIFYLQNTLHKHVLTDEPYGGYCGHFERKIPVL